MRISDFPRSPGNVQHHRRVHKRGFDKKLVLLLRHVLLRRRQFQEQDEHFRIDVHERMEPDGLELRPDPTGHVQDFQPDRGPGPQLQLILHDGAPTPSGLQRHRSVPKPNNIQHAPATFSRPIPKNLHFVEPQRHQWRPIRICVEHLFQFRKLHILIQLFLNWVGEHHHLQTWVHVGTYQLRRLQLLLNLQLI